MTIIWRDQSAVSDGVTTSLGLNEDSGWLQQSNIRGNLDGRVDFGRNSNGSPRGSISGGIGIGANTNTENFIGGGSLGVRSQTDGKASIDNNDGISIGINLSGQTGARGEIGINEGFGVRGGFGVSWGGSLGITFGKGGISITGGIKFEPYGNAEFTNNRGRGGTGYGIPPGNIWSDKADPFSHVHCDITIVFASAHRNITCYSAFDESVDIAREPIPLADYFGSTDMGEIAGNEGKNVWGNSYISGHDYYGRKLFPDEQGLYGVPKKETVVNVFYVVKKADAGSIRINGKWIDYPAGTYIGPAGITTLSEIFRPSGIAFTSENLQCHGAGNIIPLGPLSYPQIVGYLIDCDTKFPIDNPNNWWKFPWPDRPYNISKDDDDMNCNCTCTNDSNARLAAEIEKIRKWLGAGDKIAVPEHLLTDKASIHRENFDLKKQVELSSFNEVLEWYLSNLTGWLGAWGRDLKVTKSVPKTITEKIDGVDVTRIEFKDEEVTVELPDIATALELISHLLFAMQDDNARALQASYAGTVEAHQARQQATMANHAAQAIIDAIGGFVKIKEIQKDLPALLSFPSESELKKMATKPYEEQIARLLVPSKVPITVADFEDSTVTLSEALLKLLDAATIIKGAFTMPIPKNATQSEVIGMLKKLVSDGYFGGPPKMEETLRDICDLAEKGYNTSTTPYGEPYSDRPKIRTTNEIIADNIANNGSNFGGSL